MVPEAQTLFTVVQITLTGRPAAMAACRAGAWPARCSELFVNTRITAQTNDGYALELA